MPPLPVRPATEVVLVTVVRGAKNALFVKVPARWESTTKLASFVVGAAVATPAALRAPVSPAAVPE
jgi:hypothetical protein